jgi:hypothetical protein
MGAQTGGSRLVSRLRMACEQGGALVGARNAQGAYGMAALACAPQAAGKRLKTGRETAAEGAGQDGRARRRQP